MFNWCVISVNSAGKESNEEFYQSTDIWLGMVKKLPDIGSGQSIWQASQSIWQAAQSIWQTCTRHLTYENSFWYLSVRCMVPVCQMLWICFSQTVVSCLTRSSKHLTDTWQKHRGMGCHCCGVESQLRKILDSLFLMHVVKTAILLEVCHEKMCFKIFVVVIPKEGLAGGAPPILLWVWRDYKIVFCSLHRLYSVVVVIPKEGLMGP